MYFWNRVKIIWRKSMYEPNILMSTTHPYCCISPRLTTLYGTTPRVLEIHVLSEQDQDHWQNDHSKQIKIIFFHMIYILHRWWKSRSFSWSDQIFKIIEWSVFCNMKIHLGNILNSFHFKVPFHGFDNKILQSISFINSNFNSFHCNALGLTIEWNTPELLFRHDIFLSSL